MQAGRGFSLRTLASVRRFEILRAVVELVELITAEDDFVFEVVRAVIGIAMGEELQPAHTIGAALGSLAIQAAQRLGELAMALGAGEIPLSFDDAGRPVLELITS